MKSNNKETLLCALGGLGEVGKNMYVVMHENELFIIDFDLKRISELDLDNICEIFFLGEMNSLSILIDILNNCYILLSFAFFLYFCRVF